MSLAPTDVPALSPVTRQLALPPAHRSSCMLVPALLVGCGLPRAQAPVVAVSVPLGLTVHPRAASKSSEKTWVTPPIGWYVAVNVVFAAGVAISWLAAPPSDQEANS